MSLETTILRGEKNPQLKTFDVHRCPGEPTDYVDPLVGIWWSNVLGLYSVDEDEFEALMEKDRPTLQMRPRENITFQGELFTYATKQQKEVIFPDGHTEIYQEVDDAITNIAHILDTGWEDEHGIYIRKNSIEFITQIARMRNQDIPRDDILRCAVGREVVRTQLEPLEGQTRSEYEASVERANVDFLQSHDMDRDVYLAQQDIIAAGNPDSPAGIGATYQRNKRVE